MCTLAVAGPYITLLFALWLFGFGCYGLCQTIMLNRIQARLLLVVSVVAWAPLALWSFPYWLRFFLVGIPFAGSIVGFVFAGIELSGCERPIRWAAGTTFTLYLAHFPIGVLMHAVLPPEWPLWLRWAAITVVALPAAFLLAAFTERRKSVWRRLDRMDRCAIAEVDRSWAATACPGRKNRPDLIESTFASRDPRSPGLSA